MKPLHRTRETKKRKKKSKKIEKIFRVLQRIKRAECKRTTNMLVARKNNNRIAFTTRKQSSTIDTEAKNTRAAKKFTKIRQQQTNDVDSNTATLGSQLGPTIG
jgi:hypothetical protein